MQSYMLLFFCFKKIYYLYVGCFACVSVYRVGVVPAEARRGCQISWNWIYRQLLATLLVSGIVSLSARATSVLIC